MRSGLSLPRVVSRTEVNSNKLRLLRELEKNPKWKTEGFYFQSNNKARLPQLSVLRQKLAVSFPYEPQKPFPKCIWQTWKVGVDDPTFPLMYKSFQQQWSQINPGYKHNVLADNDCHEMVAKLYTSVPEVAKAYQLMPKSILKADFFRYLILYAQGGVYADIDTRGIKPIDSWLSNNKKLYNKPNTAGLVVGIEADPDRPDWNDWYSRRIQFCQWAIQAKKGHPMLKDLIAKITELTLERSKNGQLKTVLGKDEGGDIMDWTGPGIWTDYVFAYMNNILQSEANIKTGQYDEIITWELFTGMQLPIGVDDVLVLPITSFSPNVGHMGSKPTSDPLCYVEHMFSGSWKHDEKPQHKPKKNH
ncbi:membrane-bound alpha-1,6 mannosyltransferase initiation-specific [Yamadazyma tenuis ATCC 10573]|uniref:Membrane-bound alpha-1,6 mannosyltransferase initiation-specific n=2 Tax=Candida tenuis TaxID=2315449 RepID=G3BA22_CANTC|nr:membrane-bound alpha-1,6 mannosyltransferase initiation-specific [Yamadazyma tenuis ATCC 10573]EGV61992.1 membrane-bound alpha-1,6 mannosyltransferase initiation-specific [Yamadazyma tenuis ATCC 10573]